MASVVWRGLAGGVLATLLGGCGSEPAAAPGGVAGGGAGGSPGAAGQSASGTGNGATSSLAGTGGAGAGGNSSAGAGGMSGTAGSAGGGGGGAATGPDVDLTDPKLHEFELDPHVLDATTADSPALEYAELDTRSKPLGKLVVFLPGANNVPKDWREHGRVLAKFGFHVVIPHYNNRWSSNGTCDGQPNSCSNDTRWEALVGEDTSAAIAIPRADSAEGRVVTVLKHLVTEHPGGDWGYYLSPTDGLLYDKLVVAGISHGAASAGLYAIKRPFTRVVMHSSGPAGNKADAKMTPLSEWYGFTHTADPAYDAIASSLANFALAGEPTSIDGASAPFASSHRLITSADSEYPHGSTCGHSSSPKAGNGNFVFEPAWRYMYGVPE